MSKISLIAENEVLKKLIPVVLSDFEMAVLENPSDENVNLADWVVSEGSFLTILDSESLYQKVRSSLPPEDMPILLILENTGMINLSSDSNTKIIRNPFLLFHLISTVQYLLDPTVVKKCDLSEITVLKPFTRKKDLSAEPS